MKKLLFAALLLAGCDNVGGIRAFTDGSCTGHTTSSEVGSGVAITRVVDGDRVKCSIEFTITEKKK